jgi:hypothetical protein
MLGMALPGAAGNAASDNGSRANKAREWAPPINEVFVEKKKAGEDRPRFPLFSGILAFLQRMLRW